MLYPNCPTCLKSICLFELDYETKKDNICNDPYNSEEEIANKISKLIQSYTLRYCCKARLLTYINQAELIVPSDTDDSR